MFGRIINVRSPKSFKNIVKTILYSNFANKFTEYGKRNEPLAIKKLQETEDIAIGESGIFTHT